MRRSDLVQTPSKGSTPRTTQIVFGERQHLLRVLDSLETTAVPQVRLDQERRVLEELIHERTRELNHINSSWDEKVGLVLNAESKSEMLDKLEHPYAAIRENVARHPNADSTTLAWLAKDRSQPLWYLVAFNPNTPSVLRRKLQDRLRKLGQSTSTK
jgi:hypothetical protein